MKRWVQKIVVAMIAVMTLGMYIPPVMITDADENKEDVSSKENKVAQHAAVSDQDLLSESAFDTIEEHSDVYHEYFINALTKQAKEQTMTKLGPRIANEVDDEITTMILPHMEEVIRSIFLDVDEEAIPFYGITEKPTDGYGEKIFNIYDYRTKQEIALFHVRRDNRPLDGYWFNFHYHLSSDNFEKHYEIGDIYWDKNIPPKWMS